MVRETIASTPPSAFLFPIYNVKDQTEPRRPRQLTPGGGEERLLNQSPVKSTTKSEDFAAANLCPGQTRRVNNPAIFLDLLDFHLREARRYFRPDEFSSLQATKRDMPETRGASLSMSKRFD